jgi:(E)-4-hydroxy-3-methylbut-2-enyl-diphosphate synthase
MRLKTPRVTIRGIESGDKNPIRIQSMTNTDTANAIATAKQCMELADAGSEIVRITVNNKAAALSIPKIRWILDSEGYEKLPLVGDFHYNGHQLLRGFPEMAEALDKYRINPGNVGFGDRDNYNFEQIVECAIQYKKPIRIGVNWGSLDQRLLTEMMIKNSEKKHPKTANEVIIDAMVESALKSAAIAEKIGLKRNKIILSVKMSGVEDTVNAYESLAKKMKASKKIYALHLGLTEAGGGDSGVVASTAALSILLKQGLGDTIRVSLTPAPGASRTREVDICKLVLQSLGLRYFAPHVTSCPGCGRTESEFFQELAQEVNEHINKNIDSWKQNYSGIETLKIAVMGCIVNGPGESRHADIAISLPGKSEEKIAPVYIEGKFTKNLIGKNIPAEFIKILEQYIKSKF